MSSLRTIAQLVFVLAALACAACSSEEKIGLKPTLACEDLPTRFDALVAANGSCQTVDDCTIVGGAGDCGCSPTLGAGSGSPINIAAAAEARALQQQYLSGCGPDWIAYVCDAARATNLRCEAGFCQADDDSCLREDVQDTVDVVEVQDTEPTSDGIDARDTVDAVDIQDTSTPPDVLIANGPLAALFEGRAHFQIDQNPVPVSGSTGHREAFAVNRPDLSPKTVYLYHRCFGYTGDASICLSISDDGGDNWGQLVGEVVAPMPGHIFAVAPSVFERAGTWYMVYEESNVSSIYWAQSLDGITWSRQGELIHHGGAGAWDEGATATPGAMVGSDGLIYVFYAGFGAGGQHMSVGVASGSSLLNLQKHAQNPILVPAAGAWDGGQVSMARPIQEGSYTYLAYEGADLDFTCDASNRYGWGLARSLDLVNWERLGSNPLGLSAQNPYGCGNDMPSIYRRDWDQVVFVYHTSADTRTLVREFLAVD